MTTLYEKRGRRYVPVAETEVYQSYPEGAHLVVCKPGSVLTRFNIDPDRAALLAAAEPMREAIQLEVSRMLAMRPVRRPITEKQRAAWAAFIAAMGNDCYLVEYASVAEIADAVAELVVSRARP